MHAQTAANVLSSVNDYVRIRTVLVRWLYLSLYEIHYPSSLHCAYYKATVRVAHCNEYAVIHW